MTHLKNRGLAPLFIGLAIVALLLVALLGVTVISWISYSNGEIALRKQVEAQQKQCEIVFDQTWKTISQQAQIADRHKEAFREIFVGMTEARYEQSRGQLMSMIQESNPKFDASLFEKLMNTVEAQRANFAREQKKLISLAQEHEAMLEKFPGSLILANRKPVDIRLVTSSHTQEAFDTGKDDDVELFPEKK